MTRKEALKDLKFKDKLDNCSFRTFFRIVNDIDYIQKFLRSKKLTGVDQLLHFADKDPDTRWKPYIGVRNDEAEYRNL